LATLPTSAPARLMSFAEFANLPDPPGGRYELHHGELVLVTYPLFPQVKAQRQLRLLLEAAAGDAGVVDKEMPFRPLPEYQGWSADVAFVSKARWDAVDRHLMGAPELVIEVLSPSNTAAEMLDREQICLENGAQEFWVVDTNRKIIKVSTAGGRTVIYKAGQSIPLFFAPGKSIPVDEVFA
jgi:Uma2 family endonuclease